MFYVIMDLILGGIMMKQYWEMFLEKIEPVKNALFNDRTAKVFRISYGVVWNLILIFCIILVLLMAFGAGAGAGYFASLVNDEEPRPYESMRKDIYNYEEPSEVYFAGGEYLGTLRSDIIREEVSIDEISPHVIDAIIATEDQEFYEHNGVVPKAVLRALFQEFTNSQMQTGGSTLTQQLVKNQILTSEVSFERKAKEILIALRLEKFFEKDEILEAYLNVSSFGRNSSGQHIAGVQAAAKGIFGVDAKDLNIPQAAFIAGLPQNPYIYTPFAADGSVKSEEYLEPGLNRQKIVLQRMFETGKITEQEYQEALEYDIVADFIEPQKTTLDEYPYLIMETEERTIHILMKLYYEKDGYTSEDVYDSDILYNRYRSKAVKDLRQNGYKIYTTIDKKIYDIHQEVVANFKGYTATLIERKTDKETGEIIEKEQPLEVGLFMMENTTGRIISFVGGRDYHRENMNHATLGGRPNGSTMKPILVYGPGIDLGFISPGSVYPDVNTPVYDGAGIPYKPENVLKEYYGLVTAREALTQSHNVSTVKIFDALMEVHDPFKYMDLLGMDSLKDQNYKYESAALGPANVTVEENTNAFAAIANKGQFIDAYMIEKIVDKHGEVIYEHKAEPVQVFSEQAAYLVYDMMRDVVKRGTGREIASKLNFSMDFAGKTGTSEDRRDLWFVGMNPNVTMGLWMGYDHNAPLGKHVYPHYTLWPMLMNAAHEVNPDIIGAEDTLQMPSGIVKREFCTVSGLLPSEACREAGLVSSDYFIAEYVPKEKDNSLIKGKYVTIDGKNYLAGDNTPDEFTNEGFILNPEFIKKIAPELKDWEQLIPKRNASAWSKIVIPDSVLEENGKIPSSMNITITNGRIQWKKHGEEDVIGYLIYQISGNVRQKIGAVKADENLSFNLPGPGLYAVTAVDIAGNESPLSNIVTNGFIFNPPGSSEPDDEDDEDNSESPGDIEDPDEDGGIPIDPGEEDEE